VVCPLEGGLGRVRLIVFIGARMVECDIGGIYLWAGLVAAMDHGLQHCRMGHDGHMSIRLSSSHHS